MRRTFLWTMLVVLLVAAFLRIWQLETYPPGPHYDEGAELLIARSIAFGGANLFPIANSYQGRETLYHYLSVPLLRFVADDIFSLQLLSVYCNLLTVAAAALGRAMFRGERGLLIGLAVGVMMAVSFHQIYISRQAFRSSALPLFQALGLLFLWQGLNKRRGWLWLAIGGFFAGLALYTYMASRLFPLWLFLGGFSLLLIDRNRRGLRLRQGLVFFTAMGLTAVPIILYALRYPDIFMGRLSEVTNTGSDVTLLESVRLHLRMFFIEGEGYVRYNAPGRPYLTLPEGLLMLVGLTAAAWSLVRGKGTPAERAACILALMSPLMVIPSVISVGGLPPNHMRSLGMVPLIFVLVAIGFAAVADGVQYWLKKDEPQRHRGIAGTTSLVFLLSVLFIGALLVGRDYFRWANRADLFYQADGDLAAVAEWLPAHVDENTLVYIASYHREHPTIITGWNGTVTWLGTDSLFLPPPDKTALVVFTNTAPRESWSALRAEWAIADVPPGPDGAPAFYAYRIPGDVVERRAVTETRNPYMTFVGLDSQPVRAGDSGQVTMQWRVDQPPPYARLRPILELRDTTGAVLSISDAFLLGTTLWRPGETMMQRMGVVVLPGTPPGEYPLFIMWVDRDSGTYLTYQNAESEFAGITAQIGTLNVTRPALFPAVESVSVDVRASVEMAAGVRLAGWNRPSESARPGEVLPLTLLWDAVPSAQPRESLSVELVLQREAEAIVLWSGQPVREDYSPPEWLDGEVLTHRLRQRLPRDLAAGRYTLKLRTQQAEAEIGQIEIAEIARVFDAPAFDQPSEVVLGDVIRLRGYSLRQENGGLTLELMWEALQSVETDYTVFVHVDDASETRLAQRDTMPQDNAYPTSLWVPGEFIVDRYRFEGVNTATTVRIGLYVQENGERLRVSGATDNRDSDNHDYIEIETMP
ncbi:MAG: hypothetical protein SF029_17750 [bacterium]|nr:hypothetical protein [bacterium]